jgi:signal transduction histidine kinase
MTRIEELYERSRNISYEEISPATNVDYDNQVHELLNDFTNEQTKVFVVGNQPSFWDRVTGSQKHELLLILSEIMVNMKKHSRANSVVIRFTNENNIGFIYYNDNGRGFPSRLEFGNGLKNTVSRIKSLNGEIIFGKSEKDGAAITISFPLEPDKL